MKALCALLRPDALCSGFVRGARGSGKGEGNGGEGAAFRNVLGKGGVGADRIELVRGFGHVGILGKETQGRGGIADRLVQGFAGRKAARHIGEVNAVGAAFVLVNDGDVVAHGSFSRVGWGVHDTAHSTRVAA